MIQGLELANAWAISLFANHTDKVYSMAFMPDSRLLMSGSSEATVRIWNIHNGTMQNTLLNNEGITSVAVSRNGQWVAAVSYDKCIHLWSIPPGEPLATAHVSNAHADSIYAASVMNGGRSLVTGSLDGTEVKFVVRPQLRDDLTVEYHGTIDGFRAYL
ncbi:WD40/YVTN repeat-like-containing domain protein [Metarhizium guizhouense ARSEF 977]|uniref:WD40/YVTN repeat-like-containing domain protein n=1 Tax=Metarhizium guizhouense (strain ARSEF 977) TaxID=1276136 RepID=A0A0B4GPD6_METGA|nr:WD40/YVTN repeat-like-containing domain protein [Metarhizium guizhouense ARSEF 977]